MNWIYIICGFVIGGTFAGSTGFIVGAIIGYLLSMVSQNKQQLMELSKKFQLLERQLSITRKVEKGVSDSIEETVPDAPDAPDYISPQPIETEKPQVVASAKADFSSKESEPLDTQSEPLNETLNEPVTIDVVDDFINKSTTQIKKFFSEGNLIVTIGIIVLFIGASFLIKYSIDNSLISIELRLAGLVFGSLAILIVGWRLREKSPGYALIMQGGAVAIIYLSIFASFKLYGLLPQTVAFPLLILFSALSMFLAVTQDSRALAITAITGGFASPILVSTGAGSHISLFSLYLILNLGIFGVSWFKSWRPLNLLGFAFTFVIGIFWGVTRYKAEDFATTEPFLIAFFLIYVAISILFAMKQKPHLKGYVDGSLVFGVPLLSFGLQSTLVYNIEYGLAWSALAVGFFYLTIARILWNNTNSNYRLLCEAMLALGVIFTTLTIPLALDGRWTAASWAIEGVGLFWIGLRQSRQLVKAFGLLIQVAGGLLFIFDYSYNNQAVLFLNGQYMGSVIVAIAGLITTYLISQKKESDGYDNPVAMLFLFWGLGWWYIGGLSQIELYMK
ncbi:MAG: putative membrane protein, partial [Enterobacterales bacterium]